MSIRIPRFVTLALLSLAVPALSLALPAPVSALDVPVQYLVGLSAFRREVVATTALTFTLHGDPSCAGNALHTEVIPAGGPGVRIEKSLPQSIRGATAPTKGVRIGVVLHPTTTPAALYLRVIGTGIDPLGGACQPQVPGAAADCAGNGPEDVMVRVGPLCVDVYEASVWESRAGGGVQYGAMVDDYPCSDNGNGCTDIFARSEAGVVPAAYATWFQAQQACKNAGKRLLTNAEWQMAAAGTPDPGLLGNGLTTCNTATVGPVPTGSTGDCVSSDGVHDMAGNLHEWVGDWSPKANTCVGWDTFSDDFMCLSGVATDWGPGALYRGGSWSNGTGSGIFTLFGWFVPAASDAELGFRCAR